MSTSVKFPWISASLGKNLPIFWPVAFFMQQSLFVTFYLNYRYIFELPIVLFQTWCGNVIRWKVYLLPNSTLMPKMSLDSHNLSTHTASKKVFYLYPKYRCGQGHVFLRPLPFVCQFSTISNKMELQEKLKQKFPLIL